MGNRLLILDDDMMMCKTMQTIAEFSGFEAQFTTDPQIFLELVQNWQPQIIALDLIMPQMDGIQVMLHLTKIHCSSHIIITSGVGNRVLDAAKRTALEHGLNIAAILPKPFSAAQLRQLLNEIEQLSNKKNQQLIDFGNEKNGEFNFSKKDLELALANKEMYLVYQPKISCKTKELKGFEVLCHWQSPTWGTIPPEQFISLAESSKFIDNLTEYILDEALQWFSHLCCEDNYSCLTPQVRDNLKLSVNISAISLKNTAIFETLATKMNNLGLSPERLILELTETAAMEDPVASLEILTRLRVQGFHLSVDDFGTGYSSMVQLVRLPFSEIKVDKSFVLSAAHSQESKAVIKSIVDLGKSLGIQSTAEGVEDSYTLDYLCAIGCDLFQGNLFGTPMTAKELSCWINDYSKKEYSND